MSNESQRDALQSSGEAADANFPSQAPGSAVRSCKQQTWVEIQLVDQNGEPVANQSFELVLPDGSVVQDQTDAKGLAGVEGIDAGECEIRLPDLRASTTSVRG